MTDINKYLVFSILSELYAIPIERVREIIRYETITPLRDTQTYLKGVINLRGKIIPIIDMRIKFGITEEEYNDRTVFIIVDINGESEIYNIGIAVDSVHEVVDFSSSDIDDTPRIGLKLKTQYLSGVAKIRDKMAMILNLDRVISTDEIIELNMTSSPGTSQQETVK